MATRSVTTWDVLDGHVTLDLQCLDRIYLNGYVPNLQGRWSDRAVPGGPGVPDSVACGGGPDR